MPAKSLVLIVLVCNIALLTAWRHTRRWKSGDSCAGRCGPGTDSSASCQCNDNCLNYNDCCDDYKQLCSCEGKCGNSFDNSLDCQCNSECPQYGNCCQDFEEICDGSGGSGTVTNEELASITEDMLRADTHNVASQITLNYQGKTSSGQAEDKAPEKLFSSVQNGVWGLPTFAALLKLHDNYERDVTKNEDVTEEELAEQDRFLFAVVDTPVMQKAYEFLKSKGVFSGSEEEFTNTLRKLWFGAYPRSSAPSSSGFEHVFIGEIKNSDVSGFHNWAHFYRQEADNDINYLGYIDTQEFGEFGSGISHVFTWDGEMKNYGSMFVGTSPEYEMAIYTICFLTRPDGQCTISMNGRPVYITTYTLDYNGQTYIGTAYPDWHA